MHIPTYMFFSFSTNLINGYVVKSIQSNIVAVLGWALRDLEEEVPAGYTLETRTSYAMIRELGGHERCDWVQTTAIIIVSQCPVWARGW